MSGVRLERRDRVAHVVLDRAPVNALDTSVIDALIAAYRRAGEDAAVGAIVFESALPKHFSAGFALDFARSLTVDTMRGFLTRLYVDLFDAQREVAKPTVAALHGAVRGAGITMALACDTILVADDAHLGYSEVDVGLLPAIHFLYLPRLIGRHRAFELLFTARTFDAAEAAAIGLATRVLPRAALADEAHALAATLAAKSPALMAAGRAALDRIADLDDRRRRVEAVEAICDLVGTPDMREGFDAFLEKRAPRWPSLAP